VASSGGWLRIGGRLSGYEGPVVQCGEDEKCAHSPWRICCGATPGWSWTRQRGFEERDWYAAAVQYGWSRNVLLNMMMNRSMDCGGLNLRQAPRSRTAGPSQL